MTAMHQQLPTQQASSLLASSPHPSAAVRLMSRIRASAQSRTAPSLRPMTTFRSVYGAIHVLHADLDDNHFADSDDTRFASSGSGSLSGSGFSEVSTSSLLQGLPAAGVKLVWQSSQLLGPTKARERLLRSAGLSLVVCKLVT